MAATSHPSSISPSAARVLIDIWFALQIVGGQFLTPILIATFLFSKAKRDWTLINLGLTFVFASIFNCLLLYANQYHGPEPSKNLCIFQAAAFGAGAPMWSVAALSLVIQMRARVEMKPTKCLVLVLMLITPYVAFFIFLTLALVLGLRNPERVTRAHRILYCSIESRVNTVISVTFTAILALLILGYGVALCFRIYKLTRALRRARRRQIRTIPLALRLVAFMVYVIFAFVTCLWTFRNDNTVIRDIYTSTFGVAYFLVFGSQRDVLRVWLFWRKDTGTETWTGTETETEEQHAMENDITLRSSNAKGVTATIVTQHDDGAARMATLSVPPRHMHHMQGSVPVTATQCELRFELKTDESDSSAE